jgi:protein TonB
MALSAYRMSFAASVLMHLLVIFLIVEWGVTKDRYGLSAESVVTVRLEAESKIAGTNRNAMGKKTKVKQKSVAKEASHVAVAKASAVSLPLSSPVVPDVRAKENELKKVAAKATPRSEAPFYGTDATGGKYDEMQIKAGLDGNRALSPVLISRIRLAIQDAVSYPPLARRRGFEGTVIAGFSIDLEGLPRDIRVLKSSGHGMLDSEVKKVIKRASPYPLVKGTIEVPVIFRLKSPRRRI